MFGAEQSNLSKYRLSSQMYVNISCAEAEAGYVSCVVVNISCANVSEVAVKFSYLIKI